ncbi:MAG: mechanosensitive ion channel domain-containing protein [Pseudomonadota bacterium]
MENEYLNQALAYLDQAKEVALDWLTSPAAWSQFALLIVAFALAWFARRTISPALTKILTPPTEASSYIAKARRFALLFLPLLLPILAYGFTAIGEQATRAAFGSGAVIEFGKNVFLVIAARILVHKIIADPFLKLLGRYLLIPIVLLNLFGLLGPAITYLDGLTVSLGNITFSVLAILRGVVAGGILFWLGSWSNRQSSDFIRAKEEMRPATRELAAKALEILIFGAAFLLLMNIMGISLSALAVLGGAIGVGLGFGLQKIASNFISGIILLLEGQATVGDFVALDGGEEGKIIKMTARATILETFDGRWIVVPNEDFIVTRVTNYSDSGSANRYEAPFSVSYDTDINRVPDIVEAAVATHKDVLDEPYPPDCELRGFGDSGIDFAVEFWVNGLDDGENKYTSDVLFLVWNALKDNGIEIPYPHRVIEIKDGKAPSKQ